jgi:N-acetyltransferase
MTEIVLQNNLVKLRKIQQSDVEAVFDVATKPEIWTHIAMTLSTKEDVEKYVATQVQFNETGERIVFVVIDQITEKIIGVTSIFDVSNIHAHCEIGATWLTPNYWRTGVNTNCKFLLLEYIFETLEFERAQIKTDNLNERSQRAIERIGATFEGRLRSHMRRKDGTMRDTIMYSIIKEEWPKVKGNLQQMLEVYEERE